MTAAKLLAQWGCRTREEKLERATRALMEQLYYLHVEAYETDLNKRGLTCSCADAYRMGKEALKK